MNVLQRSAWPTLQHLWHMFLKTKCWVGTPTNSSASLTHVSENRWCKVWTPTNATSPYKISPVRWWPGRWCRPTYRRLRKFLKQLRRTRTSEYEVENRRIEYSMILERVEDKKFLWLIWQMMTPTKKKTKSTINIETSGQLCNLRPDENIQRIDAAKTEDRTRSKAVSMPAETHSHRNNRLTSWRSERQQAEHPPITTYRQTGMRMECKRKCDGVQTAKELTGQTTSYESLTSRSCLMDTHDAGTIDHTAIGTIA